MKNSNKLMEERGALVEELETILNTVSSESRDFTDEENERQDSIHAKIVDLDEAIQRAKNNEAVFTVAAGEAVSQSEAKEVNEIRGRFSMVKAITDIANKGGLEGLELEMVQEGRSEMQRVGQSARGNITIPSFLMRSEARANETYTVNVGSSTTQNQGDAVRGIDHLPMVEALRPVPVLERMGATVINATGDVVLPSLPDAEAVAAGETQTVNNIDGDFGDTKLQPKRFGMRMDLSRQLMNQADPALDAVIARDMSRALANALDNHVITEKFFATSNITDGTSTTTVGAATDYADLVSHEGGFLSQDPAGGNLCLLMDPTMASYLKGVVPTAGGPQLHLNGQVLGYDVFTSTQVDVQHVNAKDYFSSITSTTNDLDVRPIFFIDPSDLFIAQFGGIDITVDPYTLGHAGTIRLIANMYANADVRRAGSIRVLAGLTANQTAAA